jgi:hypothetical protein
MDFEFVDNASFHLYSLRAKDTAKNDTVVGVSGQLHAPTALFRGKQTLGTHGIWTAWAPGSIWTLWI